jgi:hypothetical protein
VPARIFPGGKRVDLAQDPFHLNKTKDGWLEERRRLEGSLKEIVVTDDELRRLERRFGPGVRRMGPWSSDGTFGYSSVSIAVVEKAAEAMRNPNLAVAVSRLTNTPERTKPFVELLETFGPTLIERIIAAYRECSFEFITGTGQLHSVPVH